MRGNYKQEAISSKINHNRGIREAPYDNNS
jgi:hypothetical protein